MAPAPAVRNVPATPTALIGRTAARKRRQPMCMPPSNRISTKAIVTTSVTTTTSEINSDGTKAAASAAPTSIRSGAGTLIRSVSRLMSNATKAATLATRTSRAKRSMSDTGLLEDDGSGQGPPTSLPGTPAQP
jgi:hypothetical protein